MAFTVKFSDPATGHPRYNFDQTIRKGARGADLQLLQVLLNLLYFDLAPTSAPFGFVPPSGRLVEDGFEGPETAKFVSHCRSQFLENGAGLVDLQEHPEARGLDPMRQPGQKSTRLKVQYFIDVLNENVSAMDASQRLGRYARLSSDQRVPLQLRNALKTVKLTANKYMFGG